MTAARAAYRGQQPNFRVLVATVVHTPTDARILHREIAAMTAAGWAITYLAPWSVDRQPPAGVRPVPVPRASGRRRLRAARAARRALAALAPEHDLVLVHDPDLVPVALSVRTARPLVWDVHEDTAAALTDRSWVPRLLRPILRAGVRWLERIAERRCRLLLAEPSYQARFRRQHPVVPNLPWARAERAGRREDDRAVYVGRLSRSRGLDLMLEVGRRLRGRVEVVLIGAVDPADRAVLERGVDEGAVTWLGERPNDVALAEVAGSVAGMSLLRDEPNFRDSTPTKVLEYMATGVPVVTTPLPEAERLVSIHGSGTVVPFDDAGAAADAVLELADDRDRWERQSRAGFEAVASELSWDRQVPAFLDVLRRAAAA